MTLYTCPHCAHSFRSSENAEYHENWCGFVGGESRQIPGISLVSGASNGVGNADNDTNAGTIRGGKQRGPECANTQSLGPLLNLEAQGADSMTVSKRTRFEILRRDNYACTYCGKRAGNEGRELTIDHVVPTALGGGDDPSNLVAACKDCNAGKTSIQPDSPLVQQVAVANATYGLALRGALAEAADKLTANADHFDYFLQLWDLACPSYKKDVCYVPASAEPTISRWVDMGVSDPIFEHAIKTAFAASHVAWRDKFRYAAGVIWNIIKEAETPPPAPPTHDEQTDAEFMAAMQAGIDDERGRHARHDLVRHHIDRTSTLFTRAFTWENKVNA